MISVIRERDLFQEQEKNLFAEGDLLIIASEEYINQHFNLKADGLDPVAFEKKQVELTGNLFSEIRKDKDYKNKYRVMAAVNNLSMVILATTEDGINNIVNYVSDLLSLKVSVSE